MAAPRNKVIMESIISISNVTHFEEITRSECLSFTWYVCLIPGREMCNSNNMTEKETFTEKKKRDAFKGILCNKVVICQIIPVESA